MLAWLRSDRAASGRHHENKRHEKRSQQRPHLSENAPHRGKFREPRQVLLHWARRVLGGLELGGEAGIIP
jgi:hypothetical protein